DEGVGEAAEMGGGGLPVLVPPVASELGGRLEEDQGVGVDRDGREQGRVELLGVLPGGELRDMHAAEGLATAERALGAFGAGDGLERAARGLAPGSLEAGAGLEGQLAVLHEGQAARLEEPGEVLVE